METIASPRGNLPTITAARALSLTDQIIEMQSPVALASSSAKYESSYEVNEHDEASKFEIDVQFVTHFRQRMNSISAVTRETLPDLFRTIGVDADENEISAIVDKMFGDRSHFLLPEAVALVKEYTNHGLQTVPATFAKETGKVQLQVESRRRRIQSKALNFFSLSEESLVSGRKLLGFSVGILFAVTFAVAIVAIMIQFNEGKSTAQSILNNDIRMLQTAIDGVVKLLNGQKAKRLSDTSSLVFSFINDTQVLVEAQRRTTVEILAATIDSQITSLTNFYTSNVFMNAHYISSLVNSSLLGSSVINETALNETYIKPMQRFDSSFLTIFYHCRNTPSVIAGLILTTSTLDTTLSTNKTYLSVFPNGTISDGDVFQSTCPQCDKLVVYDKASSSCTIGIVLKASAILRHVRNGVTSMVNEVNKGMAKRNDTTEIVLYEQLEDTRVVALSDYLYCKLPSCPRIFANDTAVGNRFNTTGGAYRLDYSNIPVYAAFAHSSVLDTSTRVKFALESVVKDVTIKILAIASDHQNSSSIIDIELIEPNSTVVALETAFVDHESIENLFNFTRGATTVGWESKGIKMTTIALEEQLFGYTLRIFISQPDSQTYSVVSKILNDFNAIDSTTQAIGVLFESKTKTLLTNQACSECVLNSPAAARTAQFGGIQDWLGYDWNGQIVNGVSMRVNEIGLAIGKTRKSVIDSSVSALTSIIAVSAVLVIAGSIAMWGVVYLIIRQIRTLILRRAEMQSRLAKLDGVLENMFPKSIKERMLREGHVLEVVGEMSVSFMDIHSFTPIANTLNAKQLQTLLSYVFSVMDEIAGFYGVNKVKTIGDCYLAVCGLPGENIFQNDSIQAMFMFVVNTLLIFSPDYKHNGEIDAIFEIVKTVLAQAPFSKSPCFAMRAGMASGNILCGILPGKVPSFDVWGPVINLASRLESNGIPGSLMVSEIVCKSLQRHSFFQDVKMNGPQSVYCKGFGSVKAYILQSAAIEVPKGLRLKLELEMRAQRHNYLSYVGDKRSEAHSDTASLGETAVKPVPKRMDSVPSTLS